MTAAPLPRPSGVSDDDVRAAQRTVAALSEAFSAKVVGQEHLRESLLIGLLAGGHILIESVPGLAKTTAARVIADAIDGEFRRIQCTPDLLPSDIVGTQIYDAARASFVTQLGPVHANIVLLDEINRSSAKTQSAMLEAMEERQTTVAGTVYPIPEPFLVIATQNPNSQIGVFPLPESQLDRFLMRLSMGYPPQAAERALLTERDRRDLLHDLPAILSPDAMQSLQREVAAVQTRPALIDYLLALIRHTREHPGLRQGLSPRAGLGLKRAAQAWAYLDGRAGVLPEDVQAVFAAVVEHRLLPGSGQGTTPPTAADILQAVAVP